MKPQYIIYNQSESVSASMFKDTYTFLFLLLCIYVSHGSRLWTFITGCMFLLFVIGIAAIKGSDRQKKFKTTAELKAWVGSLPDDPAK